MSNKFLVDQKRSSLDLSDSESDGENYRKGGYSNKYNLKEAYSPSDDLQSPDTNSLGPTPKSILKENLGSASKSRKNILINETLNETHRIPQKSDSNMTSPDKNASSVERDSKYRDYIREEMSKSASSGYSKSDNQSPYKGGGTDDDEEYDSKMSAKYSKDTYGEENSSFKNRLVVGNISSTDNDFKRAYVRKLQQEREQEISSRAVRESADQVREKWQLEKERKELDTYGLRSEKENGYSYSKGFEYKKTGLRDYEDEYGYRKADTLVNRGVDPSEKFERIENKISNLEQDLNSYSKSLVKSAVKQEEKNKDLDKVCEEFEDRMKDLKDEIDQSINEHRKADQKVEALTRGSRGFSEERTRPVKAASDKAKSKTGTSASLSKSSKHGKSADRFKGGKTKGTTAFKKLQNEIERLRYENEELKDKLTEKEMKEKARTIKAKTLAGPDLERETELLETIERIKKKLRHSITKKVQDEKNRQKEAIREEAAAQSFGRNYTSYGFHYQDILKRKALEDKTLSRENMMLLHKGLPTTYKNYEGPIFAEKLTKSKKKI